MATYQNEAFAVTPVDQITQQQSWSCTVVFDDDVSAFTYEAELRSSPDATNPVEISIDDSHAGTTPFSITLTVDGSLTTDLLGLYVWDLWELDDANDTEVPIAFGRINVNATVTQIGDTEA